MTQEGFRRIKSLVVRNVAKKINLSEGKVAKAMEAMAEEGPISCVLVFLLCIVLLFLPNQVMANKEIQEERMTSALFLNNRPPEQDGSGRILRLQKMIQRHEVSHPVGWEEQVDILRALSPIDQLRAAHRYVNRRLVYVDHLNIWKTPQEAFLSGGVCVEYATSKMLLLRDAGFPESSMRVVTLRPIKPNGVFHVVLLASLTDGQVFVLDSPNRAQSEDIVPLTSYRERIRPVVWAGWRGGFETNDSFQAGVMGSHDGYLDPTQPDRTAYFSSGDRLVDIAADLRVVRHGETPLSRAERQKLALLRRYYHEPTAENRHPLTKEEIRKLNGIRTRLSREEGIKPTESGRKFFFD